MLTYLQRTILPLEDIHSVEVYAPLKGRRCSFLLAYEKAEGNLLSDLDAELAVKHNGSRKVMTARQWLIRREKFLAKYYVEWRGGGWWTKTKPNKQHCALIWWGASPTPERLKDWLRRERETMLLRWSMEEVPF